MDCIYAALHWATNGDTACPIYGIGFGKGRIELFIKRDMVYRGILSVLKQFWLTPVGEMYIDRGLKRHILLHIYFYYD